MIEPYLASFALGAASFWLFHRIKKGTYQALEAQIIHQAEKNAQELRHSTELDLKNSSLQMQRDIDQKKQEMIEKACQEEERIRNRETKLEQQLTRVEKKLLEIEKREQKLLKTQQSQEEVKQSIEQKNKEITLELELVGQLTSSEAQAKLTAKLQDELKEETAAYIRRAKRDAKELADRDASHIIATAIQRLAVSCVSEATVNTVAIPNEEMKRRIIGREGRNIKTLEKLTGVSFSIDNTPGAVVLSGFDPVRMHVAKLSLTDLVKDGRIHPTRIEEIVEKTQSNVQKQIKKYGRDAANRAGAGNLHPELIQLLGQLKLRYSYGQNILEHSLEVSHIMGLLAAELQLDIRMARRIGLLHDIGKAVSHEMEGSHALIGRDLALKCGETPEVANGIGCHHNEVTPLTVEGSLCGAADAISASRPGARVEAVEEYVKRLKSLETIATHFSGVDTAYAIEAGREVRVVVKPDQIDDDQALILAHDISKKIENDLTYPGRIKVTVSREKRVVYYAH